MMKKINWRKWNNIIHRDLGYFFFGLTIIYAVSGFAANHLREWNSDFIVENSTEQVAGVNAEVPVDMKMVEHILSSIGMKDQYKSHFRPAPDKLQIFLQGGGTVEVDTHFGLVTYEKKTRRPVLREMNYLHLNQGKRWWTWVADFYAVGLFLLAVTGLFVLKGKNGITGRGMWITLAGFVVPVVFLVIYFY